MNRKLPPEIVGSVRKGRTRSEVSLSKHTTNDDGRDRTRGKVKRMYIF